MKSSKPQRTEAGTTILISTDWTEKDRQMFVDLTGFDTNAAKMENLSNIH
jgi:hypothetical protein